MLSGQMMPLGCQVLLQDGALVKASFSLADTVHHQGVWPENQVQAGFRPLVCETQLGFPLQGSSGGWVCV